MYDKEGNWHDTEDSVPDAFLKYYKKLLGSNVANRAHVMQKIIQEGPLLTNEHKAIRDAPYTIDQVKKTLYSVPGCKAVGPYGFGTYFYRDSWSIVREEVVVAVFETLQSAKLLKKFKNTFINLIPRTSCPKNVTEFNSQYHHGKLGWICPWQIHCT